MLHWCGEKETHWPIRAFQTWFYLYLSGGDFCLSSNLPSNCFDFQRVAPPPCCGAALFWKPLPSSTLLILFLLTDFADFPSSLLGCDALKHRRKTRIAKTWRWANEFDKTKVVWERIVQWTKLKSVGGGACEGEEQRGQMYRPDVNILVGKQHIYI